MNNFVFERSSGFAGYRNTKTGEWKRISEFNKSFISLEDFLAQEDSHRIHYMTGRQFLCYYQLAKASYLQFGEDGPPVGAKVITYFAGHGGNGHNTRIFGGNYGSSDSDYFELNDPSVYHVGTGISIVEKETWWRHIAPIDPEIKDFGGLPPFLTKKLRHTELETMIAFICGR